MSERDEQAVAWRWRPIDASLWIYDPDPEWLESQGDSVEKEPLYPESVIAALRAQVEELKAKMKECNENYDLLVHHSVTNADRATAAEAALAAHKASAGLPLDMQHEPADFVEAKEMLRRAVAALAARTAEDGLAERLQFETGDVVGADPRTPLHSGSSLYPCAIVVSANPLILISEEADMCWSATVKAMKLYRIGKATPPLFAKCMARYLQDIQREAAALKGRQA